MNEQIQYLLENLKQDITRKQKELTLMEEDPLLFLEQLMEGRSGLIPMVLGEKSEESLLEYQEQYYPKVISALIQKYQIDDFRLTYDSTIFPSPIYFSCSEGIFAELHPYERKMEVLTLNHVKELLRDINEREMVAQTLEEELKMREIEQENPMMLGGGNPLALMKIVFTMKNTKTKIRKRANEQLEELSFVKREVIELEVELEEFQNRLMTSSMEIERIAKRLNLHYGIVVEREMSVFTEEGLKPKKSIEQLHSEQNNN